ncbi:MAG TPA: hypothetical protein VHW69_03395 [Rhizomicrobium sp.]|nr:hypothetical protein [Rhizomicrobium sp.]
MTTFMTYSFHYRRRCISRCWSERLDAVFENHKGLAAAIVVDAANVLADNAQDAAFSPVEIRPTTRCESKRKARYGQTSGGQYCTPINNRAFLLDADAHGSASRSNSERDRDKVWRRLRSAASTCFGDGLPR